ncbi:MAG: nucleotidyltransferase domain-containing protein [Candidatus Woesearchaeota archaeon]|jgi:predicted nucleotidyltransferase
MKQPLVTKKYLKLLVESSTQKILEVLYTYPEKEFSLSDLAKEANVAKPHVGRMLEQLSAIEFVEITKLSKIWRIKANQQNWNFVKSKIIHNLNFIYQSGLVEFLNQEFKNPRAIVLFGSFRKGEDISTSDIDIAIELDNIKEYQVVNHSGLEQFEKTINRKIQIHLFDRKTVDINVFNNIANGILLWGFLEVKP